MRSPRPLLHLFASAALVASGALVAASPANAASEAPVFPARLLGVTDTSTLAPTSPDPSGVVWMPDRQRLMISDGEVEEMPLYAGTNLYETTLEPTVTRRGTTLPGHAEPTGVAYNPDNGHLFVSNDDLRRVYEYVAGPDATFGTDDDTVTSFSTSVMGNTDPEDVTYDSGSGDLFVVDGLGHQVTRVSAGTNGTFDGVPPFGDDTFDSFDLAELGARDPEGIGYDAERGTLLVVDDGAGRIFELTRKGTLVNAIDISALSTVAAAGITVAPRSGGTGGRSYYVVDRGLDNDLHPDENDGRLFEIAADLPEITNLPPFAYAGEDLEIELPSRATLRGVASDDGLGEDGEPSKLKAKWKALSGPEKVEFDNDKSLTTTATFKAPGVYTLRLTVEDGQLLDTDELVVTVIEEGGVHRNSYPVLLGTDDAEQAAGGFVSVTSADLELVDDGLTNQTVGVRFSGLGIPREAVIERASIQFQTDEVSTGPASLVVHGEAADDAAGYQAVSGSITVRPRTQTSVPWVPPAWTTLFEAGAAQRTPDLGPIVEEIVQRPGWQEGNAMAFMISGTGTRTAEARDGTSAPVLLVDWRRSTGDPGPGDDGAASLVITDDRDDAVEGGQDAGEAVELDGKRLQLGGEEQDGQVFPTVVGLRYRLPVPAGAVIDRATIRFTSAKKDKRSARLLIRAQTADDAGAFEESARDLSLRAGTAAAVTWTPGDWEKDASGPRQTTPDLAAVLQEVVDRPGWRKGNHAALLVTGEGQRTAKSFRGDKKAVAVLDLTWH